MAGGSVCAGVRGAPLVCTLPFAICCEGKSGALRAETADIAVGPVVAVFNGCGLAPAVIPVAGSAFPGGHSPLEGFFLVAKLPASDDVPLVPFVCADDADIVEVEELVDAMDEDEFCRWTVLRGPGLNILLTSSEFMAPKPLPLAEPHPKLEGLVPVGWKFTGVATAVIGNAEAVVRRGGCCCAHCLSYFTDPDSAKREVVIQECKQYINISLRIEGVRSSESRARSACRVPFVKAELSCAAVAILNTTKSIVLGRSFSIWRDVKS